MTVGIAGLGLIGGSLAKAYQNAGWQVLGYDGNRVVQDFATLNGTLNGDLTADSAKNCDLILIALYPDVAIEYLRTLAPHIPSTTMVMDCCGTKSRICEIGFALAVEHGFTFVGGHPMAGTQFSGFANSKVDMFQNCSMIVVPSVADDILLLERIKSLVLPAGFSHIAVTTAKHHDEMIAYTSQMCHIVSNAFVKSPTAQGHKGYSAGSYHDLTRVAWLNEHMWSDLFIHNAEPLLDELSLMISNLQQYEQALRSGDRAQLCALLAEGRVCKEKVDAP